MTVPTPFHITSHTSTDPRMERWTNLTRYQSPQRASLPGLCYTCRKDDVIAAKTIFTQNFRRRFPDDVMVQQAPNLSQSWSSSFDEVTLLNARKNEKNKAETRGRKRKKYEKGNQGERRRQPRSGPVYDAQSRRRVLPEMPTNPFTPTLFSSPGFPKSSWFIIYVLYQIPLQCDVKHTSYAGSFALSLPASLPIDSRRKHSGNMQTTRRFVPHHNCREDIRSWLHIPDPYENLATRTLQGCTLQSLPRAGCEYRELGITKDKKQQATLQSSIIIHLSASRLHPFTQPTQIVYSLFPCSYQSSQHQPLPI